MPPPTKLRSAKLLERLTRNSYPGILCGIGILILTGLPGSLLPHEKPIVGLDKIGHVLMYATFAFCCLWGYRKQYISNGTGYRRKAIIITIIIGIAYGGLTEIMQETLVPGRVGDWYDLLSDVIGTCLGTIVFDLFFKNKK